MAALFRFMLDLCLLRSGPQQLPPARLLLGLFVVVYLLLEVVLYQSLYALHLAAAASVVDTLLAAAFVQTLLLVWGRPERFIQTLTSLLSAWVLLGVVFSPLIYAIPGIEPDSRGALLITLGLTLYLAWSLAVMGNILHHALEVPLYGGIGLGVVYFLLSQMILSALLPVTGS